MSVLFFWGGRDGGMEGWRVGGWKGGGEVELKEGY